MDGGRTYPYVLAGSTPNTGSASVVLPMVGTTHARVKIEAVDNVFFDVSTGDFAITWLYSGFFDKEWSGTCRDLQVLLVDGAQRTARFSFK